MLNTIPDKFYFSSRAQSQYSCEHTYKNRKAIKVMTTGLDINI